ncbi:TrwC relaxase [Actinobacteria bacterium YIM 96077]|uniref:TrwC relaxase n=1 Tax=Phytoactinopolyspora halophila TaxID=1981511 RepID=A0A329QTE6_9ACTN|nr:MobF family relaxase [Phytoactinopolyspora halophila]AYY13851.1 TrwC relaxase [Actinobacteria bacterium YIM 96077]RAW15605.1 TrwC relaxase [Phytoactinopolyspora halophila]
MKGGVILFRGAGTAARRYLESDRSRADDYYLEAGTALAHFTVSDSTGQVIAEAELLPGDYAGWVDWQHPLTGEQMGKPRAPGDGRRGSPRFAEMVVNAPKSLSIAAALHPEVSVALDAAQRHAVAEISRWLAQHSVTRVGPRGRQEVVPVEQVQTVAVSHKTSRAGDPHRHIHFQVGARVRAGGAWRALDTAALFKQQGAIRALGTAVIAAHPGLAGVLDRHGLTLDPVTGEVTELERFNQVMSKRAAQVERNLTRIEAEWQAAHPGVEPGPVLRSRWLVKAWAHERPNKKPTSLADEEGWRRELADAGYHPETAVVRRESKLPVSLDDLSVQQVANRALDRCAAAASTWTVHAIQEHVTRITTEHGVRATCEELREFIAITTRLASEDCLSVLPQGAVQPEHVAHLTSLRVVQAETELRDLLQACTSETEPKRPDVTDLAAERGLDDGQTVAAAAVASTDPLVIVEGAAGAGKTTMLAVAITAAEREGRRVRVVAPTKKAADVAHTELGVPADSVAALVCAHGWRWNTDGDWTRLTPGDTDPNTGLRYAGPPEGARLVRGERVIVDEAGMLDQDTALAFFTVAHESGATVALVGDRAQLSAVGRGGVLDMAAHIRGTTYDMTGVHRFTDPDYAALTVHLRAGADPAVLFDRLHELGLIQLHADDNAVNDHIANEACEGAAITVATNDDARALNEHIRTQRAQWGEVVGSQTVTGSDGLDMSVGDVIQTRKNDRGLRVANRQTWTIQHIADDGTVRVREAGNGRKRQHTVALPAEYVNEHTHLAYAATAYGVQGATASESHTILTDALEAAAVYVGMTRGRNQNVLHVVAPNLDEARDQFVAAMQRDRADRGLADATKQARDATRGLIEDGPVKQVNTELAALDEKATHAERRAKRWEWIAKHLDAQTVKHAAEAEQSDAVLTAAKENAAQMRDEIAGPLISRAMNDARTYLDAVAEEAAAARRLRTAGWLARRRAYHDHHTASQHVATVGGQVRDKWGRFPASPEALPDWAARAASRRAEADLRVVEADSAVAAAKDVQQEVTMRQRRERLALLTRLYGPEKVRRDPTRCELTDAHREVRHWQATADQARAEAARLRALPPQEAAQQITQKRAVAAARQATAERARQLRTASEPPSTSRSGPHRGRSGLGF